MSELPKGPIQVYEDKCGLSDESIADSWKGLSKQVFVDETELTRLRAIEAAAREVIDTYHIAGEAPSVHEKIEQLRRALGNGG